MKTFTLAKRSALIALIAALFGCPDQVSVVDFGPPEGGEAGVMAGAQPGGAIAEGQCFEDGDCGRGDYCDFPDEALVGSCREGCRAEPDSCATGGSKRRCDLETRACVLTCEDDLDCFEGDYCDESGRCQEGCRLDDPMACPGDERGPQRCEPSSRRCVAAGVCCDLNDSCSLEDPDRCYETGGEVLEGLLSCQPNPCGALCNLDALCADGEYCSRYGRCAVGCRVDLEGGCPPNLACDEASRRCVALSCESDEGCPAWQFCGEGQCRDGCREGSCPDGLRCDASRVCRDACERDEDCEEGYCDDVSGACRPSCEPSTHAGCGPNEACLEGRCVVGCADDLYDAAGDDSAESPWAVEWLEGQEGGSRSSARQSRALCLGDEDWVSIPLALGERVELRLSGRPSSGDLLAELYEPGGSLVATGDQPWGAEQRLAYPALGQGVSVAGDYLLRLSSPAGLEDQPYTLLIRAAPSALACFSDELDPDDDNLRGARALGLTPALRFTELAEGSLCFGDRDLMCFPMNLSDGLDLIVDAPADCDPLSIRLTSSGRVDAPLDTNLDYRLVGREGAGDWADQGGARYELRLDPESSAFTNDLWCAQLSAEGELGCEGYRLSATFSRRQLVCSDLREPNNVLAQATSLDGAGPLADGAGQVPYDTDLSLSDPLYLCQGERDIFRVESRSGDAWRAWIIDQSDPEGEPEDRGQLIGSLRVRFMDDEGNSVGDSATVNPRDSEALLVATAITPTDGPLYLQVDGLEDSEGPYQLALRRVAPTGPCSQDINEPAGRDDLLNPVSTLRSEGEQRLSINNGYLCDPDQAGDEDWYRFELTQNNTRLCLNSSFRQRNGDVDLELYELGDRFMGEPCVSHADCRGDQADSSCIEQRCRAPLARSASLNDGEMIHISSAESRAGTYYARVFSPEAAQNAYQLSVSYAPPSSACSADFRERLTTNDRPQDATPLGSGHARVCDAWLCDTERVEGDWYEVVVPAGAQRTLHLSFESQQGRLSFTAEDASSIEGQIISSPRSPSRNMHCVNVIAGPRPATVKIQVSGDTFNVGQRRVDYVLSVAPVDINLNPRGACDALSGGLFSEVNWPSLDLRE